MSREYAIIYHSFFSSLKRLSDSERGRLLSAVLNYSINEEVEELRGAEIYLFDLFKEQIDREKQQYKKQCELNKVNGKKGGRPSNVDGKPKKTTTVILKPQIEEKDKEENKYKNEVNLKEKVKKEKYGEFENVLLTSTEVERLRERLGNNFESLLEEMSSGIAAKGYKYKDHYAALLNWSKRKNSNEGGIKNGSRNSTDKNSESKPRINKYPNHTQYDDSWFKKQR